MTAAKWLVVGASGLVGGELTRRLASSGREVTGTARGIVREATRVLDLGDRAEIERTLHHVRPDVIVIASAWPHVDGCEADPERSHRENVETVQNLVAALAESKAKIVFYSTDHVFDGSKGAEYVESDAVNPPSVYARHKCAVEEILLARGRSLVLRTAWVFGQETRRKNFVYRVISAARAGETLRVPIGQAGRPTWSGWLTDATMAFVEDDLVGIVHATGGKTFTKAEWARAIAEALGLPALHVEEVDWKAAGQVAPRPVSVELRSERHARVHPDPLDVLRAEAEALLKSAQ
jgi:dTDP-4-dehydrorhamnose reductase